ncbi:hypothetical protein GCM10009557_79390 [Virgisporangium ochraceum]|uniref:Uncharacterized protein n=1 Tax=Virgisporangium ochraceum TaxID=65505 RepID=A0A8J4EDM0_9ACTN|nr:hypothetical protein Voc01_057580 [Virgisporangium ochraceum]
MTLVLGLAGGAVAAVATPAPAQAGTLVCGNRYFLRAASTNTYISVDPGTGLVYADITWKGWWQQFRVCRETSWDKRHFVLKSEAASAGFGADSFLRPVANDFAVFPHTLENYDIFMWDGGNPYWGLVHASTGRYLSVSSPLSVYPGPANLGWGQALYRES